MWRNLLNWYLGLEWSIGRSYETGNGHVHGWHVWAGLNSFRAGAEIQLRINDMYHAEIMLGFVTISYSYYF